MHNEPQHDELEQGEKQLRLATSRVLPADASLGPEILGSEPLDSEIRAQREAFLALGRAVDATAGQFDEAALLARLHQSCLLAAPVAPRSLRSTDSVWQAALGAALALAALVAIVRITAPLVARPSANQPLVAGRAAPQPEPSVRASGQNESVPPPRGDWFDPLDAEIALAQVEFQRLNADSRGVDRSLWRMNERLEALSQELFQGSL